MWECAGQIVTEIGPPSQILGLSSKDPHFYFIYLPPTLQVIYINITLLSLSFSLSVFQILRFKITIKTDMSKI
jgi:hypothetical protein